MTVGELIEELKKYPLNWRTKINDHVFIGEATGYEIYEMPVQVYDMEAYILLSPMDLGD